VLGKAGVARQDLRNGGNERTVRTKNLGQIVAGYMIQADLKQVFGRWVCVQNGSIPIQQKNGCGEVFQAQE
jgi:hypothetical protein